MKEKLRKYFFSLRKKKYFNLKEKDFSPLLSEIGLHIEGKPSPQDLANAIEPTIMTFGKYKGRDIKSIPAWYRKWLLENIKWNGYNRHIEKEILRLKDIGI